MLVRFRMLRNIKIQEGETQRKYKKIENLILPSPQTTIIIVVYFLSVLIQ